MIKLGDIVYQVRRGGFVHDKSVPVTNRLGLVIKVFNQPGAVPQFFVQFDQEEPMWYYQHDLQKVEKGK